MADPERRPWDAEAALDAIHRHGAVAEIPGKATAFADSLHPANAKWLADRLTVLWMQFSASRASTESDALTIWLAETIRLLGDLPHDIAAGSIDQAVKSCRHGFLPSVGEIRGIADPLAAVRRQQAERLEILTDALSDETACTERAARWEVARRQAEYLRHLDGAR